MIDDDSKTDPAALARLMRHVADDVDGGRFPDWVNGRIRRRIEDELHLWMGQRREIGRHEQRSNVVPLRRRG